MCWHSVDLVPEKSNFAILDKSIRAQAFWQDLKSTNRKNQITNKIQDPISEISNEIKALDSSSYFVHCDLQFEIYPRPELRGQAWELLFDIWNFRFIRVRCYAG